MLAKLMLFIVSVSVCAGGGSADLVEAMGGRRGGNRVTLCAGAGAAPSCAGALLRDQWVLARASCLQRWALYKVLVLRDSDGLVCEKLNEDTRPELTRKLLVRVTHPSPGADLALLAVDRRYSDLDSLHVNTTLEQRELRQSSRWMDEVFHKYPLEPRPRSHEPTQWLLKTPLRMFLTTMVVPTAVCALLFVLALSVVGGGGGDLPYDALEEEAPPPRDLPCDMPCDMPRDKPLPVAGDAEDSKDDTDTWPILYNL